MLDKFGITNYKIAKTSIEERIQLTKASKDYVADLTNLKLYQQLEGTLIYLSTQTWSDITYAINKLGQFLSNPTLTHWNALKQVLKYIKETPEIGIIYGGPKATLELLPWIDSSWGDNLDDTQSTYRYLFMLGRGLISWKSQKQHFMALSTAEAEYVEESHCGTIIEWFQGLLQEL